MGSFFLPSAILFARFGQEKFPDLDVHRLRVTTHCECSFLWMDWN